MVELIGSWAETDADLLRYVGINRACHNFYGRTVRDLKKYRGLVPEGLIKALGGIFAFAKIPELDLIGCERYQLNHDYIDFVTIHEVLYPIMKGKYGSRPFLTFIYASPPRQHQNAGGNHFVRYWSGEILHARYTDTKNNFKEWTTSNIKGDLVIEALLVIAGRATEEADVLDRISRLSQDQPVGEPVEVADENSPGCFKWIENPQRMGPDELSRVLLAEPIERPGEGEALRRLFQEPESS